MEKQNNRKNKVRKGGSANIQVRDLAEKLVDVINTDPDANLMQDEIETLQDRMLMN